MTEAVDTKKDNPQNNNIALAKVEPLKVKMNTSSDENTIQNNTVKLENSSLKQQEFVEKLRHSKVI